jgi:hypothetical protein
MAVRDPVIIAVVKREAHPVDVDAIRSRSASWGHGGVYVRLIKDRGLNQSLSIRGDTPLNVKLDAPAFGYRFLL